MEKQSITCRENIARESLIYSKAEEKLQQGQ